MGYELINEAELTVFRLMVRCLIIAYGCNASARRVGVPQDYMSKWANTGRSATRKNYRLVQQAYERMKDEKKTTARKAKKRLGT